MSDCGDCDCDCDCDNCDCCCCCCDDCNCDECNCDCLPGNHTSVICCCFFCDESSSGRQSHSSDCITLCFDCCCDRRPRRTRHDNAQNQEKKKSFFRRLLCCFGSNDPSPPRPRPQDMPPKGCIKGGRNPTMDELVVPDCRGGRYPSDQYNGPAAKDDQKNNAGVELDMASMKQFYKTRNEENRTHVELQGTAYIPPTDQTIKYEEPGRQ